MKSTSSPRRWHWHALLALPLLAFLASCCGVASCPEEADVVVTPATLKRIAASSGLSSLWYIGSDRRYHYFTNLYRTGNVYQVKKADLDWQPEFRLNKKSPVLAAPRLNQSVP